MQKVPGEIGPRVYSSRWFPGEWRRSWRCAPYKEQLRMREDMHKVVVERERHGSWKPGRKWGQRLVFVPNSDYEDQPMFASSARGRQYSGDSKHFSDVLGPLRGFVRSNIGRPWDKVFSELRQGLDVRKVTGLHIFDHVKWMVETDCWIGADRKIYAKPKEYEVTGFYVHPRTGLLCFATQQSRRERKKLKLMKQEINEIRLEDQHSFRLIDGQWYFVDYEIVEVARYQKLQSTWDVIHRRKFQLTWGCHRIAVKKRQCNRDEVREIRERIERWEKQVRRM